ncbi:hypothetical protein V6N13_071598 [Hibiscus sabdariffa]|uniref:Uncharacterized protein n=1 Tax=Hibiscus sabdariffa TaxID=183260 RepID=A0ABR2TDU3_9ROSI
MSEESGENRNPNSRLSGLPSGRPPDLPIGYGASDIASEKENQQVQGICSGPFLERPSSPIATELQRQCKKSRGDIVHDLNADLDSMEDGGPLTYAGIVGGLSRRYNRDSNSLEESTCDPNSVEVLDEDCVESCVSKDGRNDNSKEGPTVSGNAKVTSEEPIKERDLFGPWMMVDNRRKQVPNRGTSSARETGHQVTEGMNRFAILESEQVENLGEQSSDLGNDMIEERVEQVAKSGNKSPTVTMSVANKDIRSGATHRVSIQNNNTRESGQVVQKVVVLPMVEGQHVSVVEHSPLGGNKEHATVWLFEKGHGNVRSNEVVVGKQHGGRRGVKDGVQHGLKVRKPPDMRTISRLVLNEWVDTMNMHIKAITTQADNDPGGSTRAVVNQDRELEPVAMTNGAHGVLPVATTAVSGVVEGGLVADQ